MHKIYISENTYNVHMSCRESMHKRGTYNNSMCVQANGGKVSNKNKF